MLPYSVVCENPIQVRPIVVVGEFSIDFLQEQVRTFRGKVRYIRIFLWGGQSPPHADHLYCCPPWGIYFSFPTLSLLFLLCLPLLLSTLCCLLANNLS